jgi:hypothetical protein
MTVADYRVFIYLETQRAQKVLLDGRWPVAWSP